MSELEVDSATSTGHTSTKPNRAHAHPGRRYVPESEQVTIRLNCPNRNPIPTDSRVTRKKTPGQKGRWFAQAGLSVTIHGASAMVYWPWCAGI